MDPLTQLSVGAAVAVAISPREHTRWAAILGAVAGAAPDLDVLIRSSEDPLLSLFYHRHFTHSLIFAPVIGLLIAVLFKLVFYRLHLPFKTSLLYATAGALTHGPIDACTSYGTLLYWPFSSHRESWDLISIIDPIFTVPLVLLTLFAVIRQKFGWSQLALVLCAAYLGFCGLQRAKAMETAQAIAAKRNHHPEVYSARPSIANNVLWRTIYKFKGRYYVDAVWVLPGQQPVVYKGNSVKVFSTEDAEDLVTPDSILGSDIERFRYFSQGYLYQNPQEEDVLGDLRYAMFPDSIMPRWGIRIDPKETDEHIDREDFREVNEG